MSAATVQTLMHKGKEYSLHLIGLSLLTGIIGGLGAILFRWMIHAVQSFFSVIVPFGQTTSIHMLTALAPAAGLVAVSLITHYAAREVKGHGVPQILEALALRGGRIRPRVGVFGILAPAITIGSGGSVGREGPIALIGAAFGSTLGQTLRLSDHDTSLLLACGAAAGIGATFNAPIAGGFFGLEVILGTYALGAMVPIFLSAVTGVTVYDAIMGSHAALLTPPYHVINHFALLFMMGLGVVMATIGFLYTTGLTWSEDFFDRIRGPFWVKSLLGGLAVGLLGLFVPQILGVGYPTMHLALNGRLGLGLLALLFVAKYVATLVTIGAGGSGGVFAPSLFIGGMAGGAYGGLLYAVSPNLAPHPAIYAVAGMAAMFAAAAQAPFVAITILLEITGDYHLTAPVMAAAAISYWMYRYLTPFSMYTVKLSRRGIVILRGQDVRPTDQVSVRTAMEPIGPTTMVGSSTIESAYQHLTQSEQSYMPVIDDEGSLIGLLTLPALVQAMNDSGNASRPLTDVLSPLPPPLQSGQSLDDALRQLAQFDTEVLPVAEAGRIVGLISRQAALRGYRAATLHTLTTSQQISSLTHGATDAGQFFDVVLGPNSPAVGKTIVDLHLPSTGLIVAIQRDAGAVIPHGTTLLESGDRIVVFVASTSEANQIRKWFTP